MKKLPILATIVLIVGLLATSAFTVHPIQSVNGVVSSYSAGSSLTVHTPQGDIQYMLRPSTVMWGFGATSGIAVTGGNGTSSSSSSSATATPATSGAAATATPSTSTTTATATPTTSATTGTAATSTPASGSSGGTTGATTGSGNVNGLAIGARVTVFGQCFSTMGLKGSHAAAGTKFCMALAVIVRAPGGAAVPATGGTSAPAATATTAAPAVPATTGTPAMPATTGTPTGVMPAGTMTPTP